MTLPFSLNDVRKITFFKRDELTTDLICCDVEVESSDGPVIWSNHEEEPSWPEWLEAFSTMPDFDSDWYSKIYQPPFAPNTTIAYQRPIA